MFRKIKEWNEIKATKTIRRLIMMQLVLSTIGFVGILTNQTIAGVPLIIASAMLTFAIVGVMVFNDIWVRHQERRDK